MLNSPSDGHLASLASSQPTMDSVISSWLSPHGSNADISSKVEDALRQAHKMEVVGHLASGAAHDINNMLQGIASALETLQRRIDRGQTNEIAPLLSVAFMSIDGASALTRRLLAFSRPQAVEPMPVSLNSALGSMEAMLKCVIGARIAIVFGFERNLGTVRCDRHQFESAILNLAINARDAMPRGGRLLIETFHAMCGERNEMAPGGYVGIRVTDTGTGMTPEVIDEAFEPFYSTKPSGRGTGLGLTMIKHFAEQCRGHASIESTVGCGTSVTLYLPRCSAGLV